MEWDSISRHDISPLVPYHTAPGNMCSSGSSSLRRAPRRRFTPTRALIATNIQYSVYRRHLTECCASQTDRTLSTAVCSAIQCFRYAEAIKTRSSAIIQGGVWSILMTVPRSATRYAASDVLTLDVLFACESQTPPTLGPLSNRMQLYPHEMILRANSIPVMPPPTIKNEMLDGTVMWGTIFSVPCSVKIAGPIS